MADQETLVEEETDVDNKDALGQGMAFMVH